MGDTQLRSLRRDDIERVCGIENRITGHSRKGFLEKRFAAAAESPDGFISCAAVRDGILSGYAIARIQEGEFGVQDAVAVLDVIGIDPDAQGDETVRRFRRRREPFLQEAFPRLTGDPALDSANTVDVVPTKGTELQVAHRVLLSRRLRASVPRDPTIRCHLRRRGRNPILRFSRRASLTGKKAMGYLNT